MGYVVGRCAAREITLQRNQVHSFDLQDPETMSSQGGKDFVSFEHAKAAKAAKVSKDQVSWCHMEISIWKKWWMLGEAEHEGWKMLEISDSTDDSNRGHLLEGLDVAAESYPQEYSGQVVWVTWIGKSVRQIQFWCNAGHYLSVSTVSYSKFAILIVWYCIIHRSRPASCMIYNAVFFVQPCYLPAWFMWRSCSRLKPAASGADGERGEHVERTDRNKPKDRSVTCLLQSFTS